MTLRWTRSAVLWTARLGAACTAMSCGKLIGESFDDYGARADGSITAGDSASAATASANPDTGIDSTDRTARDADVVDSGGMGWDAGESVLPDRSPEDGSVDAARADAGPLGDAGDAAQAAPTRLGRAGGCEGVPFRTFEFDQDVQGWKLEADPKVDASVGQELVDGGVGSGALRFSIGFTGADQMSKILVGLSDYPKVQCLSARIQVAPNTFDENLMANPGTWTLAAISLTDYCYAQRSYDKVRDLSKTGVWYEVAFDTKDFKRVDKGTPCDFSMVDAVVIGITTAYETKTAKPAEVFIDHVALY